MPLRAMVARSRRVTAPSLTEVPSRIAPKCVLVKSPENDSRCAGSGVSNSNIGDTAQRQASKASREPAGIAAFRCGKLCGGAPVIAASCPP